MICPTSSSPALARFKPLVRYAWDFLNLHGFINFGAGLPSHPMPGHDGREDLTGTVVVIGAGLAGCAAASQLQRWGYRVIVLEGRNRPGGRVHTLRMEVRVRTLQGLYKGSLMGIQREHGID